MDFPAVPAQATRRIGRTNSVFGRSDSHLTVLGQEVGEVEVSLEAAIAIDRAQAIVGAHCTDASFRQDATLCRRGRCPVRRGGDRAVDAVIGGIRVVIVAGDCRVFAVVVVVVVYCAHDEGERRNSSDCANRIFGVRAGRCRYGTKSQGPCQDRGKQCFGGKCHSHVFVPLLIRYAIHSAPSGRLFLQSAKRAGFDGMDLGRIGQAKQYRRKVIEYPVRSGCLLLNNNATSPMFRT